MNISENLMQDQRDLISVGIVHQVPKMSFMTIDKEMDFVNTFKTTWEKNWLYTWSPDLSFL